MTPIAPSAKTADQLTAHYVSSSEERERRKMEIRAAVMADIAAVFVAYPDLQTMTIIGYTPGFNDGDPCTHGQNDVYLNGVNKYGDTTDEDDDKDEYSAPKPEPVKFSKAAYATIGAIVAGMADDLHMAFETNWKLKIHRNGDSIEYDQEDYDCGY